jgi:hypothetical protein
MDKKQRAELERVLHNRFMEAAIPVVEKAIKEGQRIALQEVVNKLEDGYYIHLAHVANSLKRRIEELKDA